MIEQDANTTILCAEDQFLVEDRESGSRAIMPIQVDTGYEVEVIKVDQGILHNEKEKERACDFMLISKCEVNDDKAVCMLELKGTENGKEISRAYNQIRQSISRVSKEYIKNACYLMAAIAGAQDKTLPSMINQEKRELCKVMFSKSRRKIANMDKLLFYVQPNARIKKAHVNISKNPRVIECHTMKGAAIPVPSMLIEAVEK